MKFLPDTRKEDIVNALMSGQTKIVIGNIEVFLKPLKRDIKSKKEKEAKVQAEKIIKALDS